MGQADIDTTNPLEILQLIAEMTDVDNEESYRNDDPRGCFDVVHDLAMKCATALTAGPGYGYRWLDLNEFIHVGDEWQDDDQTWKPAQTRVGKVVTEEELHFYRRRT